MDYLLNEREKVCFPDGGTHADSREVEGVRHVVDDMCHFVESGSWDLLLRIL